MGLDFEKIEQKWQNKWQEARIFEPKPDKSLKKYYLIFAYPGISGYLHLGHMSGYCVSDVVARYKRMCGYNVFFPVGTHASGNVTIGFANKVKRNDEKWINYLINNGCPKEKIKELTTPEKIIEYFNEEYISAWKRFGFSANWDAFTCTAFKDYQKFIEWQFKKLKDLGLLVQKSYYATACVNCGPVAVDPSQTDLSKGGNAEIIEYYTINFRLGEDILPAATLRPETVFGVVNMWVNPEVEYVRAKIGSKTYILSPQAAEKLKYQEEPVEILDKIQGKNLIGKYCENPITKNKIIILPAKFVDPNVGTGVVMSVPAHAPYDYIALRDIQNNDTLLDEFGLPKQEIKDIKPISLINVPGFEEFPAKEICEKEGIESQNEKEKLEKATEELYLKEFSKGILKENCGDFAGKKVNEIKDKLGEDLIKQGLAGKIRELSEEVVCRCGGKVVIKKIPDQWFIKYSDKKVTEKAIRQVDNMQIFPESFKKNFPSILVWFKDRPCARLGNWIGTPLPFDKKWIIEPIADSTIYPAYYVVSRYFNAGKITLDDLTEEFFDYVFLGKGEPKKDIWKEIREEFDYWYPLDMNIGGKEHETVHFPVFLKNHVAIFPEKYWPLGIGANGWLVGKGGSKLSKSKGGAEPLSNAAEKYGVDAMRFYFSNVGEFFSDVEWDPELVINYRKKIDSFFDLIKELHKKQGKEKKLIDRWILSKLNISIQRVRQEFDKFNIRKASDEAFFNVQNLVDWYLLRGGENKETAEKIINIWLRLLSPFIPHISEELWQIVGYSGFVSIAKYPFFDESLVDKKAEAAEDIVIKLYETLHEFIPLVEKGSEKKAEKIYIYLAPEWKYLLYSELSKGKKIREIMADERFADKKQEIGKMASKLRAIPEILLSKEEEYGVLEQAKEFFKRQFGVEFEIQKQPEYDPENNIRFALPGKPSVFVKV